MQTLSCASLHRTSKGSHPRDLDVHLCGPLLPAIAILAEGTASLAFFSLKLSVSVLLNQVGPTWALPMLPSRGLTLFGLAVNCCGDGNKCSWYVSGNATATFFPMHQRTPLPRPSQAQASRGLGNWPWVDGDVHPLVSTLQTQSGGFAQLLAVLSPHNCFFTQFR